MKIKTLCILSSMSLFYCIPGIAGSITDSYSNGSTLTATMLDNVKSAVNDNDSRITSMFSGDGSAGALTISASTNWISSPPANYNFNFTNCTINAGFTLTVPSGTTIKCSGNFINNGTITVQAGTTGSSPLTWGSGPSAEMYSIGHPGDSLRAASGGAYDFDGTTTANALQPGYGGIAIPIIRSATAFNKFQFGGGSGGGHGDSAGKGGGILRIFAGGSINNSGNINANGGNACCSAGGGGGGIIILGAISSITNTSGTINANGGDGAASYSYGGAAGGGGGGIVIFVSPTINYTASTATVDGGTAGINTTNVTNATRLAGGGGGASGGNGGNGGNVSGAVTGIPGTASNGSAGYIIELQQNPINLIY